MKLRWLSLVLITSLLAVCGSGLDSFGGSDSDSSDDRHYEEDGGFSLVPPSGWELREFPGLKYKIFTGTPVDGFAPNLNIVDEPFRGSLDEYVRSNIVTLERLLPDFEIISQEDFQLDSDDRAVKLVTTNVQNSLDLEQTFYLIMGHGTGFVITATKVADDDRDFAEDFDASARTFELGHR